MIGGLGRPDVRIVPVENHFFGGNIAVTGLLVGADVHRALAGQPAGHRYLLPDVCLSRGVFLDGSSPDDLPHPVEVVPATGEGLRTALTQADPTTGPATGPTTARRAGAPTTGPRTIRHPPLANGAGDGPGEAWRHDRDGRPGPDQVARETAVALVLLGATRGAR